MIPSGLEQHFLILWCGISKFRKSLKNGAKSELLERSLNKLLKAIETIEKVKNSI